MNAGPVSADMVSPSPLAPAGFIPGYLSWDEGLLNLSRLARRRVRRTPTTIAPAKSHPKTMKGKRLINV
jgi:hypothetical protein